MCNAWQPRNVMFRPAHFSAFFLFEHCPHPPPIFVHSQSGTYCLYLLVCWWTCCCYKTIGWPSSFHGDNMVSFFYDYFCWYLYYCSCLCVSAESIKIKVLQPPHLQQVLVAGGAHFGPDISELQVAQVSFLFAWRLHQQALSVWSSSSPCD